MLENSDICIAYRAINNSLSLSLKDHDEEFLLVFVNDFLRERIGIDILGVKIEIEY